MLRQASHLLLFLFACPKNINKALFNSAFTDIMVQEFMYFNNNSSLPHQVGIGIEKRKRVNVHDMVKEGLTNRGYKSCETLTGLGFAPFHCIPAGRRRRGHGPARRVPFGRCCGLHRTVHPVSRGQL